MRSLGKVVFGKINVPGEAKDSASLSSAVILVFGSGLSVAARTSAIWAAIVDVERSDFGLMGGVKARVHVYAVRVLLSDDLRKVATFHIGCLHS